MMLVMGRGGSVRRVVVLSCAAVALLVLGAPAADASIPKWLAPPFHRYTLSLVSHVSFQGSALMSYPSPEGLSPCEFHDSSYQGKGAGEIRASYSFVFGRYRLPTGGYRFAFVDDAKRHTASGHAEASRKDSAAPGCQAAPEGFDLAGGYGNWSCSEDMAAQDLPSLEISERGNAFALEVMDGGDWPQQPKCTGDKGGAAVEFDHFHPQEIESAGRLVFRVGQINAGRTIMGRVAAEHQPTTPAGSGTEPEHGIEPKDDWSYTLSSGSTLTLAPQLGG